MDVLEHIENENIFLSQVLTLLKDGGQIIITVPAFEILFSNHDVKLKHFRRYNIKSLKKLLEHNQIIIENYFYFYSILFFIRLLSKISKKIHFKGVGDWKYSNKSPITKIIKGLLNLDFSINLFFAKYKINFVGLSVCAICRKKY
jgi:hypothetical protein